MEKLDDFLADFSDDFILDINFDAVEEAQLLHEASYDLQVADAKWVEEAGERVAFQLRLTALGHEEAQPVFCRFNIPDPISAHFGFQRILIKRAAKAFGVDLSKGLDIRPFIGAVAHNIPVNITSYTSRTTGRDLKSNQPDFPRMDDERYHK